MGFSLKSMYENAKSLCDKDQESELIDKTKHYTTKQVKFSLMKSVIASNILSMM